MVEIRQRKGPSGPFDTEGSGPDVLYAQSVTFSEFVAAANTVEQDTPVYYNPVPEEPPSANWSLIANPNNTHVVGDPPLPPDWMPDWSQSHVRIAKNDVDMNDIDPAFPVGTLGVLVRIGMSYMKDIVGPVPPFGASFDVMLIQQIGEPRSTFVAPR